MNKYSAEKLSFFFIFFLGIVFLYTVSPSFSSAAWDIEAIDSVGPYTNYHGSYPSIAIDSNDKTHISYNNSSEEIRYATNVKGIWVTSTIDVLDLDTQYTSIAVDSNNRAHISYYGDCDLKYATNVSGSWVVETVDGELYSCVGKYSSIAIDSKDKVHISYYDFYSGDLKYATNVSGSWVTVIIDSSGDVGKYTSIAMDSNDKVHISYYDENQDLVYATNKSGAWNISVIDSTGNVGSYSSIAIDSNNKVHISYCYHYWNAQYGDYIELKYATNVSGSWVTKTVDNTGRVGEYTSIAIDSNNKVHISYSYIDVNYSIWEIGIKYASNKSGTWGTSTIRGDVYSTWLWSADFMNTSIAIDSKNLPHIALVNYANQQLELAHDVSSPPAPPSSLTTKPTSSSSVVLTWKDNSTNEKGFRIERKLGVCGSTSWSQIKTVGTNATTYTNTGLTPNTTYSYRVRAYNQAGNSSYSNCASAKTGVEGSPNAPSSLRATSVSTSKINICWNDNSSDEKGFKIYRKIDNGSWKFLDTTDADVKCYSDINADWNASKTTYSYYVKACKDTLCSPNTYTAVVPYKPMSLIANPVSSSQINLSWEDNSTNETGFQIYRKTGLCSSPDTWRLVNTTGAGSTSYSSTGLTSGTIYSYRVRAYYQSVTRPYAYGYSSYSNCGSATTP